MQRKKNENLLEIGESLAARKSYSLLKLEELSKKSKTEKNIIMQNLNSDKLEEFYPHFDLKKYGKPNLNLTKSQLTSTNWFKTQITKIVLD